MTALCLCLLAVPASAQIPAGRFKELITEGVTVFSPTEIRWTLHLEDDTPLPESPDELAGRVRDRYHREGYSKAIVAVSFDGDTGRLVVNAHEGRIDAIAFEGVDQGLAEELRDSFSVKPGDLYNTRQISRALRALLRTSRGALSNEPFDLIERDGRRTLIVHIRRAGGQFDTLVGTDSREDWYSVVDGLNLALGFNGAVFDQRRFNHTYLQGYVSYKFARERLGYRLAFERPVIGGPESPRLLIAADVHESTSSDDFWRLSITEQSLVSLSFKNSFRDYYTERGYQVGAAFMPAANHEVRFSWRADRHESLANDADYSLFRGDETFRSNRAATDGKLRALVLGYTLDSRGLDLESGSSTLRRHTGPDLFGTFAGADPGVRVDWTSEVARSGFGGDFDFTRHIANARAYLPLSPAQRLNVRLLFGTSTGTLPAQRSFALGGIGTVHGYSFKEVAGERMVLVNAEYHLGSYRDAHAIGFLDVGRVYRPVASPAGMSDEWLKGLGVGLAFGDLRVDFGWRANDIPKSLQVLVRFGHTF